MENRKEGEAARSVRGELAGQVAFVTGAGSGIGRAAAIRMAEEGAAVAVLSHTADEINELAADIRGRGGRAIAVVADVSNADDMKRAVEETVAEFERIDIVLANAGINGVWAPIDELQPDEWNRTLQTNLFGTYLAIHHAVPHLKRAGGGSIMVTASINGTRVFSNAGATAYSCSKAAQLAMVQMLALELSKHRIRVNAICPGRIDTEIQENTDHRNVEAAQVPVEYPAGKVPLTGGKPGSSEDVAELVLFLASQRSRHISGTPVWIDGAQSMLVG